MSSCWSWRCHLQQQAAQAYHALLVFKQAPAEQLLLQKIMCIGNTCVAPHFPHAFGSRVYNVPHQSVVVQISLMHAEATIVQTCNVLRLVAACLVLLLSGGTRPTGCSQQYGSR